MSHRITYFPTPSANDKPHKVVIEWQEIAGSLEPVRVIRIDYEDTGAPIAPSISPRIIPNERKH